MSNKCGGLSTTLCGVATTWLWVTGTVTPRAVSLRSVTLTLLPRNWGGGDGEWSAVTGDDTDSDTDSDGPHPTDTPRGVCEESYAYPHRLDPGTSVGVCPTLSQPLVSFSTRRSPSKASIWSYNRRSTRAAASIWVPSPGPILTLRSRPSGARAWASCAHSPTQKP